MIRKTNPYYNEKNVEIAKKPYSIKRLRKAQKDKVLYIKIKKIPRVAWKKLLS